LAALGHFVVFVMDVNSRSYLHISKTIEHFLGIDISVMYQTGAQLFSRLSLPKDKNGVHAFETKLLTFLYKLGPEERALLTIAFDYQVINSKGITVRVFQQNTFLRFSEDGKPAYKLGTIHDITHLKDSPIQHCRISWMEEGQPAEINFCYDNHLELLVEVEKLTNRQLQILFLLSSGKSSKKISEELSISTHTVDNHRRQLLEKLKAKDTTALISLARLHGMLPLPDGSTGNKSILLGKLVDHYLK
jgi:DNA-binding CsgD family transcriptional regulator